FLAQNTMVPRTKSAVIVLSNAEYTDPGGLANQIMDLLLQDRHDVPKVAGPPPKEVALALLHQMQKGAIDRSNLGEEFSLYLSDAKVRRAAPRLAALGEPERIVVEAINERGGMEVAALALTFKTAVAKALLYRTPDGKIQEFLLFRP